MLSDFSEGITLPYIEDIGNRYNIKFMFYNQKIGGAQLICYDRNGNHVSG